MLPLGRLGTFGHFHLCREGDAPRDSVHRVTWATGGRSTGMSAKIDLEWRVGAVNELVGAPRP
jgi:hypothetical protein